MESHLRECEGMTAGKMKGKMRIMFLEGRNAFTLRDMNSFMRCDFCCEADGDRRRAKSILSSFDWRNKLEEEMMNCE
jgi:hypothetical protein